MTVLCKCVRSSAFLMPTLREVPAEAAIASHRLMLRAGMIRQSSAGIYIWLPLGLRVLYKIADIVREGQNDIGAQELLLPTLQPAELWERSGRYDSYGDEMLRLRDRHNRPMLYGPTNEEQITELVRQCALKPGDFPQLLYQIQWKFRDERRPRFGVMRGREFLMKDAYSFDLTEEQAMKVYRRMFVAYLRIFGRLGLRPIPMRAETGTIGGSCSHEFIVLAPTGESLVYCDRRLMSLEMPAWQPEPDSTASEDEQNAHIEALFDNWTSGYAATQDTHQPDQFEQLAPDRQATARGIEVGHVFYFGTKYAEALGCAVASAAGKAGAFVHSGSYGIGISRLVAALIEIFHDERGITWPVQMAPFDVHLANLAPEDAASLRFCDEVYAHLARAGLEVLYDDRALRPGVKFADMDLIGIPFRVLVGQKNTAARCLELSRRDGSRQERLRFEDLLPRLRALRAQAFGQDRGDPRQTDQPLPERADGELC